MKLTTCAVALLFPLATTFLAPEPPARKLVRLGTLDGDFVHIGSVVELPGGKLLISDFADGVVKLANSREGPTRVISSKGEGPLEYRAAGGLYLGVGDTVMLLDRGLGRVLFIGVDGAPLGTRRLEFGRAGRITGGGEEDPYRLDASARVYRLDRFGFSMSGAGAGARAALVRHTPASAKTDTIAELRQPETVSVQAGQGVTLSRAVRFSAADGWAVGADGFVAIVRAEPFRVEWHGPDGSVVAGPVIPYDAIRVTEADRAEAEAALRSSGPTRISSSSSAGTANSVDPSRLGEPTYADVKPPFHSQHVLASPDGRVWFRRYTPAGLRDVVYDAFDRHGTRTDRIALPPKALIVGFGRGVLFVSEPDTDGVPQLATYRL